MSRQEKVAEAIRQEVSLIVHNELKDPRLGFVTITGVELSQDKRHAKVLFSVLGKEEDHKKTSQALNSSLGLVRKLVAERINLRFAPEIIFREDRSSEYSVRIEEVLNQIKELNEPKDKPKKSRRLHKKK